MAPVKDAGVAEFVGKDLKAAIADLEKRMRGRRRRPGIRGGGAAARRDPAAGGAGPRPGAAAGAAARCVRRCAARKARPHAGADGAGRRRLRSEQAARARGDAAAGPLSLRMSSMFAGVPGRREHASKHRRTIKVAFRYYVGLLGDLPEGVGTYGGDQRDPVRHSTAGENVLDRSKRECLMRKVTMLHGSGSDTSAVGGLSPAERASRQVSIVVRACCPEGETSACNASTQRSRS